MKKWWQLVKSLTNKTGNASSSLTVINDRRVNDDELCSELNCYFKSVGGQLQQVVNTSDTCDAGESSPLEHVSIGESRLTPVNPVTAMISLHGSRWKAEMIYVFLSIIS